MRARQRRRPAPPARRAWWLIATLLAGCASAPATPDAERWAMVYNGRATSERYALGLATAPTPAGPWQRRSAEPILRAPAAYQHLAKSALVATPSGYCLLAEALRDDNGVWTRDILVFTSADARHWTAPEAAKVAIPDAGRPTLLYEPDDRDAPLKAWYRRADGRFGLATSTNGIDWTEAGAVAVDGDRMALRAWPGAVVRDRDRYVLFYEASRADQRFYAGVATARDAAGPYTAHTANPLLVPETAASSALSRDAAPIDAVVAVADVRGFVPRQPVILVDRAARWELARVRRVLRDGIELVRTTPQPFRVEDGAELRSWAVAKVYVTHAWKQDGEWLLAATAFDPHFGLTSSAVELTGLARGSSLDTVRWDYARSPLLLPPASPDAWDRTSMENPTIARIDRPVGPGPLCNPY